MNTRDYWSISAGYMRDGLPAFDNDFDPGLLFSQEPENRVLAKFTYWFSIWDADLCYNACGIPARCRYP